MLGISPGNLGLHSARKGASSHASSSTTVSPPMVSICLCAMWSMGHVKECYLQFEKAGEHYLGQVLCGLNVNDVKFAVPRIFLILMPTPMERKRVPADFKQSSSMKSDHRKMKGLIASVIAGANQVMEMDWHNGAWGFQRALQLCGGGETFVCIPIQINLMLSEQSDKLEDCLQHIHEEWEDICYRVRHGD